MAIKRLSTPLDLGKELGVAKESPTTGGSEVYEFSLDSEAVLISLFVAATSGDVNVSVNTEGAQGQDVEVIVFPTITAPTSELLLRKTASVLRKVRVYITYTGACTYDIRARGVSGGASSFKILGNSNILMSQIDASTTPIALIPASLTDRASVAIKNYNTTGVLFLGGTAGEADPTIGWPVGPQESYVVDVSAGQEIYGRSDAGTIDVRLSETGG